MEAIGIDWNSLNTQWEKMFASLCKYKEVHGHCNVPQKYIENPELGIWVSTQRSKKYSLAPERIKRLDEIGFVWKTKKSMLKSKLQKQKADLISCDLKSLKPSSGLPLYDSL